MIVYQCTDRIRGSTGKIVAYELETKQGEIIRIYSDKLKELIRSNQIIVTNLKLTSDGRVILKHACNKASKYKLYITYKILHKILDETGLDYNRNLRFSVKSGLDMELINSKLKIIGKPLITKLSKDIGMVVDGDNLTIISRYPLYLPKNSSGLFEHSRYKSIDLSNVDTSEVEDMSKMFMGCSAVDLNLSNFNTARVRNMSLMFSYSKVNQLVLSSFNTSEVTDMSSMFLGCVASNVDIRSFDTSRVEDMSYMFSRTSINELYLTEFDTKNVIDMSYMFNNCSIKHMDISNFNTMHVKTMAGMFNGLTTKYIDISNFDTKNVTDMNSMFMGFSGKVDGISKLNTSKVEDMSNMFSCYETKLLDLSNFDTSNVINMKSMFKHCGVTELDISKFDTSKVINMQSMFAWCTARCLNLLHFNTSEVRDMSSMFKYCTSRHIELSKFNTSKVKTMAYMFTCCNAEELNLRSFDTCKVASMNQMFTGSKVGSLDLSSFYTPLVTDFKDMFLNCRAKCISIPNIVISDKADIKNIIDIVNINYIRPSVVRDKLLNTIKTRLNYIYLSYEIVQTLAYVGEGYRLSFILDINSNINNLKSKLGDEAKRSVTELDSDLCYFKYKDSLVVVGFRPISLPNIAAKLFEYSSFKSIDLSNIESCNVENISELFGNLQANYINASSLNLSNATNSSYLLTNSIVDRVDLSGVSFESIDNTKKMIENFFGEIVISAETDNSILVNQQNYYKLRGNTSIRLVEK